MLGDGAVGKTSLIRRYVEDQFKDDYIFTIGVKATRKDIPVKIGEDEIVVNMVIWDILGQTDYHRTQSEAFRGAAGALLVTDITRKETLESIGKYWVPQFEKEAGKVPVVLLANKADLKDQMQFSEKELSNNAKNLGEPTKEKKVYLTSAKTGLNVEEAFQALAKGIARVWLSQQK